MKNFRWLLLAAIAAGAVFLAVDRRGRPETPGSITAQAVPVAWRAARADAQHAAGEPADRQILFGDLHVHTTYSVDAFAWSMPVFHGEGVHPPAEACDYARFCSNLDFWATTEHAESLTPRHWRDLKDTVRQCNAVAGDPANPDLVTFLGWEWTQMGDTAAEHYGHKNVILYDTADDRVPARPIGAGGIAARGMKNRDRAWYKDFIGPYLDFGSRQTQFDQQLKTRTLAAQPVCPDGVPERELPADCLEYAATPHELFAKLDDWGFDALVIPHGNTWGFYTPPGASWDHSLTRAQHDPKRQVLIEVFSGHGNSENFRKWREAAFDANGQLVCPEPTPDYLPSCWQAGELIRARCGALPAGECEQRVREARADYLAAGRAGHLVVPGARPEDWLDAGQCRDCFLPAFNYRPRDSAQYALAISNFGEKDESGQGPLRFRFGFIASSDNHAAQPGTGFKQVGRHANTESYGQDGLIRKLYIDEAKRGGGEPRAVPYSLDDNRFNFMQIAESERVQSFFYTGGLVAVHAAGRTRDAIWGALQRREVYATSGERMLLWFDLLGAGGSTAPMGSAVTVSAAPRFRVRAVGDFEQLPGCPAHSVTALSAENVERVCRGECYHPSDRRKPLDRIEVIRILPQQHAGEDVADLIEDPWRTFRCSGDPAGCTVEFSDPEPKRAHREAIYYVRAVEKAAPAINAGNLRCETDARGACVAVRPCYGDERVPAGDDCREPAEQRAWSSPIYVAPAE
ncbi:MAG TPA: DUF3604 domain-containing protein [Candidatus Binatia bacterium]|nr:DUF3604 domain-containing protein [Candidatus Binatia bacterium]